MRVAVWGEQAEQLHRAGALTKAAEVYVEGRVRLDEWSGPDGAARCGLKLSAWRCEVLGAIGRRAPRPPRRSGAAAR